MKKKAVTVSLNIEILKNVVQVDVDFKVLARLRRTPSNLIWHAPPYLGLLRAVFRRANFIARIEIWVKGFLVVENLEKKVSYYKTRSVENSRRAFVDFGL